MGGSMFMQLPSWNSDTNPMRLLRLANQAPVPRAGPENILSEIRLAHFHRK
jgi:hypothetical protein